MLERFGHTAIPKTARPLIGWPGPARRLPTENPETAEWVAWTCALAPDAVADLSQAITLANKASKKRPNDDLFQNTPGAVLYRAGRFEEAIERLTEADRLVQKPAADQGRWPG